MLNEERVKNMTKMAIYECGSGQEDIKISSYFKKDYTSMHALLTVIWTTIGYVVAVALALLLNMEKLLGNLTMRRVIIIGAAIIIAYVVVLIVFCVISSIIYNKKYNIAKQNVKTYYRQLGRLNRMYEKENM